VANKYSIIQILKVVKMIMVTAITFLVKHGQPSHIPQ
jgi:hypothetical protein